MMLPLYNDQDYDNFISPYPISPFLSASVSHKNHPNINATYYYALIPIYSFYSIHSNHLAIHLLSLSG
jgi:hypothetical protein